MEKIKKGNEELPTQTFKNKIYYLYPNERYFSKGCKRLHRVVWEHHFGKIPSDYHIHHKDGDTTNNSIGNLNMVNENLHLRFEGKKRFKDNPEFYKDFQAKGIEKAKDWHKSEEGINWHIEQAKKYNFGVWNLQEIECEECKKVFKPKNYTAKFCTNTCKSNNRRKSGIDNIERECEVCKKEFTINKYRKNKTCSRACTNQLNGRNN